MAIDKSNEPWDYGWSEWKALAESTCQAISSVNNDVLVMVKGVGSAHADGSKEPFGNQA